MFICCCFSVTSFSVTGFSVTEKKEAGVKFHVWKCACLVWNPEATTTDEIGKGFVWVTIVEVSLERWVT